LVAGKKKSKKTPPGRKRNLVARAGARTSAGPMKDKRKLSRQEQAVRDRLEIAGRLPESD
jgi:hypothetical protein